MKVQYYSEILKRFFDTEEACAKAEKEWQDKHALEIKAKEERVAAAKEVESAYKKYLELRAKFIEKYGSYHMTITDKDLPALRSMSLFDSFFDLF